jgi:hypothetical protein
LAPMALVIGEGSEANVPLARALIGGLLVSTFITLFFIPVLHMIARRRSGAEGTSGARQGANNSRESLSLRLTDNGGLGWNR